MNRDRGVAFCGLACCLCESRPDCPGCRRDGCESRDWCKNLRCCREKGLDGCWECESFPCGEGMTAPEKEKPLAFSRFIRDYGEERLLDCLERNERAGVIYHDTGKITGDYDRAGSGADMIRLLLEGPEKK